MIIIINWYRHIPNGTSSHFDPKNSQMQIPLSLTLILKTLKYKSLFLDIAQTNQNKNKIKVLFKFFILFLSIWDLRKII